MFLVLKPRYHTIFFIVNSIRFNKYFVKYLYYLIDHIKVKILVLLCYSPKSIQNKVNPIKHTYTPLQASSEVLHELLYKDFSDIVGDSFPVLSSPSYRRKLKEQFNIKISIHFEKLNDLDQESTIQVYSDAQQTTSLRVLNKEQDSREWQGLCINWKAFQFLKYRNPRG